VTATLTPMLAACAALVPKASQPYTPQFALLGGAARALRPAQRRNLMTVVHQAMRLSCFKTAPQNVSVLLLAPEQEAAFGLVSAGLLQGRARADWLPVFLADAGDVAFATLAADVAQSTFSAALSDGSSVPLVRQAEVIGNRFSPLHEHLRTLNASSGARVSYPCLPTGYERTETVVVASGRLATFRVVGAGNGGECETLLQGVLNRVRRNASGVKVRVPRGAYVALGGLEAAMRALGTPERANTPAGLRGAAVRACGQAWAAVRAAAPSAVVDDNAAFVCERATWISVVLQTAYDTSDGVTFDLEPANRVVAVSATRGFIEERAPLLPVGAPPRGVRCDEIKVVLTDLRLPRLIIYQCDCIKFVNEQLDTVRYISSSKLLNEVMPSFASSFLYPPSFVAANSTLYPTSEYRVCSSLSTPPGVYTYEDNVRPEAENQIVVRTQRTL
jgi:hypothetical protein